MMHGGEGGWKISNDLRRSYLRGSDTENGVLDFKFDFWIRIKPAKSVMPYIYGLEKMFDMGKYEEVWGSK